MLKNLCIFFLHKMPSSEIQKVGAMLRELGDLTNQSAQGNRPANENIVVILLVFFIYLCWTHNQQRREI